MEYLEIGLLGFFFTLGGYLLISGLIKLFTPNEKNEKKTLRVKVKVIIGFIMLAGCYYFYSHFMK